MQDISKHFDFTLNLKEPKILKSNIIVNYGDDVTFTITVLEDNEPKDLTSCSIDFIVSNENRELNSIVHKYEQGGLSIEGNVVTVICKNTYIDRIGANFGQLFIYDLDQSVSTQQFLFVTNSTLCSGIIEDANEKINTLIKLDESIEVTSKNLEELNNSNTILSDTINNNLIELTDKVNNEIINSSGIINAHMSELDSDVSDFEDDINSRIGIIKNTVDYELIKINRLTPISITGSTTTIGFESKIITIPAIDLVRSAFDFCVSGSPSSTQIIQSATGHIVFYVEVVNGKQVAKARLTSIIDTVVQGKTISPSIYFLKNGQLVDTLDAADIGYKIVIRAGIHINNISSAECSLSSLARNINL